MYSAKSDFNVLFTGLADHRENLHLVILKNITELQPLSAIFFYFFFIFKEPFFMNYFHDILQ